MILDPIKLAILTITLVEEKESQMIVVYDSCRPGDYGGIPAF